MGTQKTEKEGSQAIKKQVVNVDETFCWQEIRSTVDLQHELESGGYMHKGELI